MSNTKQVIIVCGHGPGISDAVARRFGHAGYPVAIVARNAERIAAAAAALSADGINARAFAADLGDASAVTKLVADVRAAFGPVGILHWNAMPMGAGDLLTTSAAELRRMLDVTVLGLVAGVQACLPDLEAGHGAVLVTGGGFAFYDAKIDAMAVQYQSSGLAIGKAAQHKTTGLLAQALASRGVYVGEVVVTGLVKGTAFDHGNATLDPEDIAELFWGLYDGRKSESSVII